MKQITLFFFAGLFSLVSLFPGAKAFAEVQAKEVALPLKTALAMAIHNNLDLSVDAIDSSLAETRLQQNRGIYDPTLSLSVDRGQTFYTGETYGTKNTTSSLSLTQYLQTGGSLTASTQAGYTKPVSDFPDDNWTDWYTSVGLTLAQPLLKNFGKETTELNITLAAYDYEDSLERFRGAVIDTVYAVIKAYNRLFTLRQILNSRRDNLNSARQLLEDVRQKGESAEQQEVEVANVEYAISQRLKELVDVERSIKDQEARLRYLIGDEGQATLVPTDRPSGQEPLETTDQAIALALDGHPQLQQLRLDLQASELQQKVAKKKLLPNLSVNASVGFRGIEDQFSDSAEQIGEGKGRWWSAGMQFSLPLGNTVARNDYRTRKLRTTQLNHRLSALEWKIRDYIEADMRALLSARIQRRVADNALRSARARVETYRKSLQRKGVTVQDLLDAENDLSYARNSQTEALETFSNAVALLWKDAGVLLERKHINIDISQPEEVTSGSYRPRFQPVAPLQATASESQEAPAEMASGPSNQDQPEAASNAGVTADVAEPKPDQVEAQAQSVSPPAADTMKNVTEKKTSTAAVEKTEEATVYVVKVGAYASSELAETRKKVIAAGLQPEVQAGPKQAREVYRLALADYPSAKQAKAELNRLQKKIPGAFIMNDGATYHLYGGSFFSPDSAEREKSRLAALGITASVEPTSVQLPTSLLTAGRFPKREEALEALQRLKNLGVEADLVPVGEAI